MSPREMADLMDRFDAQAKSIAEHLDSDACILDIPALPDIGDLRGFER